METFRLISMTDFVLEQREKRHKDNIRSFWICEKYANFLKQPLKLEMFVPCDEDGNVLGEPYNDGNGDNYFGVLLDEYQKAKEKVLFEGFELNFEITEIVGIINNDYQIWFYKNGTTTINSKEIKTIEDLIKYDLTLTPNAIKQLGL